MVTVVPPDHDWSQAFSNMGKGVADGYMQASDQKSMQRAIEALGDNPTGDQIINAINNTKTYSLDAQRNMYKQVLGQQNFKEMQRHAMKTEDLQEARNTIDQNKLNASNDKQNAEKEKKAFKETSDIDRSNKILEQLGLPEEQLAALRGNVGLADSTALFKNKMNKQDDLDRKTQEKNAEKYISLTDELSKLDTTLENINYGRELSRDLGKTGTLLSMFGLSKTGKELEAVTFPLIDPIIKIFNPSGPLAAQKLKRIQDMYAISGSDAPWHREAKIDSLERFAKQAKSRASEKLAMLNKYDGNPPKEVLERFDKETETLMDVMLDYDVTGEEVDIPGLPDAKSNKGKTYEDEENGESFYSDGMRWITKKK